jgi:predicted nuclease of restriction endonuclease-like RecB superfamily
MLTADLVRATARAGQLKVKMLAGPERERARELAASYIELAAGSVGSAHHELKELWSAIEVPPREIKLAAGLLKLVEDACEFEAESAVDPRVLREALFALAAERRKALAEEERFERGALLAAAGAPHGLSGDDVERALFADLKSQHRLLKPPPLKPETLVEIYDVSQLQAVLLRAVQVRAWIECASVETYRDIFKKLKFRRLLFRIEENAGGGYRIDIDGPFSLFESVTKYGLQLALMLPALLAADKLKLEADVRWGKTKSELLFTLERSRPGAGAGDAAAHVNEEVTALQQAFEKLGSSAWRVAPAQHILDLPGVGLCVPDLRFEHASGAAVFLEVMGYWSRDAVWRRVELVEKGIGASVVFAVSSRLRVSEAVLEEHPSAALYVYKGALSAKSVLERLDRLLAKQR